MIDFTIQKSLHLRLPEYATVRWFFFPVVVISTWLLFRVFPHKRLTLAILRTAAGVLAIGAAPVWWLCCYGTNWDHPSTLFGEGGFYELVVALWCVMLYLRHRWPVPNWASLLLLLGHYIHWLWQFRGYLRGYWVGLGALLNYTLQDRSWFMRLLGILTTVLEAGWSDGVAVTALMPIVGLLSGLAWVVYRSKERPDPFV